MAKCKKNLPKTNEDKELWFTIDATILHCIYVIISHYILHTILDPSTMVMEISNRLCDIFKDNKHSRAVTLEYNFIHVNMKYFPSVSAYCQHLKSFTDKLKNVSFPLDNNRLVLQLVSCLIEPYKGVDTLICQRDTLPQFYHMPVRCSLMKRSSLLRRRHIDHHSHGGL